MVSTPIADPTGASVSHDARGTDSRWLDHLDADAQSPGYTDPGQSTTLRPQSSTNLQGLLERIVLLTRSATGADICALLRNDPASGTLRASVIAGSAPRTRIAPIAMHPLPGAEPVPIELADSHLTGWLASIPRFGAVLVAWAHRTDDIDAGIVELAARLAAAAIDQHRTGTLNLAWWQIVDSLLGTSAVPVVARDRTGRLFHVSQPARNLLGIGTPPNQRPLREAPFILALDLRDQLGLRISPSMLPSVRLRAGKPAPDLVVTARIDDANRRWLLLHSEAVRDGHGSITIVLTTIRDFSPMQRYGETQWLRARVTGHLRQCPIDLESIEHDIAAFFGCSCVVQSASAQSNRGARSEPTRPRITTWRESDDAATELRIAHGHLHHAATRASLIRDLVAPPLAMHTVDIPMDGNGETHARLMCCREAHLTAFQQEEIELLAELAEQIGLALTVSSLRESLHAGERKLMDIDQRLHDAEEAERRRMALSIHDGLAQVAASVCQQIEILIDRYAPTSAAELQELERARDLARLTVREARQLISGLRPVTLDTRGLGAAVHEMIETLRRDGWTIHYVNRLGDSRFAADLELDVYRVVQEAITNARKYARTPMIDITLEQRGTALHFDVRDHGAGFDPAAAELAGTSASHVGLGGMRERVMLHHGLLHIDSAPSCGTHVFGEVPILHGG